MTTGCAPGIFLPAPARAIAFGFGATNHSGFDFPAQVFAEIPRVTGASNAAATRFNASTMGAPTPGVVRQRTRALDVTLRCGYHTGISNRIWRIDIFSWLRARYSPTAYFPEKKQECKFNKEEVVAGFCRLPPIDHPPQRRGPVVGDPGALEGWHSNREFPDHL